MSATMDAVGQVRRRALLLLGGVFVAGLLGGIGIDRLLTARSVDSTPAAGRPMGRPWGPPMFGDSTALPPYLENLGLDSVQRSAALAIMRRMRPRMDSATQSAMPAIAAIVEETRREIEAILTPEQRGRVPRGGGPPFLRGRSWGPPGGG